MYQEQVPFAVVGSREETVMGGNKVRVRQYPWGTVESELVYLLMRWLLEVIMCHDLGDMCVMRVRCVMIWGTCMS